jgi:hypothetical protein
MVVVRLFALHSPMLVVAHVSSMSPTRKQRSLTDVKSRGEEEGQRAQADATTKEGDIGRQRFDRGR